ncbi:MAG: hypothetical protein JW846_05180 [Dehalococcoidia bacterium]|nr:hypothetical protein [Dehalococcoidia bacterium]
MTGWEDELAEIIARKDGERLEQAKTRLRDVGRGTPCRHFSGLSRECKLGYELYCLTCQDYEPHETPGSWDKGYAMFENGRVLHLVKNVKSNGFFRSGWTLCGRALSEEDMAVEIYPLETFEQVEEVTKEPLFSDRRICRSCLRFWQR